MTEYLHALFLVGRLLLWAVFFSAPPALLLMAGEDKDTHGALLAVLSYIASLVAVFVLTRGGGAI